MLPDFRTLLLTATVAFGAPVSPTTSAMNAGEAAPPVKKDDASEGPTPVSETALENGDPPTHSDRPERSSRARRDTEPSTNSKRTRKRVVADAELRCLALNIYHEARSEPEKGREAVAAVTLNRVKSKSFPGSVCAVVKQGGQKRHRCQFSWWCDGRSDAPTEKAAWRKALELGRESLLGLRDDPTNGALFYHADHVRPRWSRTFHRTARIGDHIFYKPTRTPSVKVASAE
jgi:spore germination cell wall hydrolase CwlJ-like protein